MTHRVVATAPVRVADVGGWTDTWFGSPGQVCHLAVGPGVTVDARWTTVAQVQGAPCVHLLAPAIGLDRLIGVPVLPPPGADALLDHAVAAVLDGMDLAAAAPAGRTGIEVRISSAVPPGASLGTSASVLVALIGALDALVAGGGRSPAEVAVLAHQVETERAGREAGVQDQWAAALGGAGLLAVGPYPDARHRALHVPAAALDEVGERLVTVVFGPHDSSAVHAQVINDIVGCSGEAHERARAALRRLATLAADAARTLEAGDVDGWAAVLVESAAVQAELHPHLVGKPHARAIEVGRSLGAVGWKVNGAGGSGGSLTLVAGSGATSATAVELTDALSTADPAWQVLALRPSPGLAISQLEP